MYIHILCLTKAPLLLAMRCDAMHSGHRLVRVRGSLNKQPASSSRIHWQCVTNSIFSQIFHETLHANGDGDEEREDSGVE